MSVVRATYHAFENRSEDILLLMIWFEKEFTWLSVSCQVCFWKITSAQLKLWQLQFIFFSQKILASPLQKQFINISLSLRKSDAPAVFQVRRNIWGQLGSVPTNSFKEKRLIYVLFCDKSVHFNSLASFLWNNYVLLNFCPTSFKTVPPGLCSN